MRKMPVRTTAEENGICVKSTEEMHFLSFARVLNIKQSNKYTCFDKKKHTYRVFTCRSFKMCTNNHSVQQ